MCLIKGHLLCMLVGNKFGNKHSLQLACFACCSCFGLASPLPNTHLQN